MRHLFIAVATRRYVRFQQNRPKNKNKDLPNGGQAKDNQPMKNVAQLGDRVRRSRSSMKLNTRPSVCDSLSRTRVSSQRQFPTGHGYTIPIREYQLDRSSQLPSTAVVDSALEKVKTKATPTIS
jgi:hypothetical protein